MRKYSLLLCLGAACASPTDEAALARECGDPPPDPPPTEVAVRLIGRTQGLQGGIVLFYGPDQTLLSRVDLAAAGIARAELPAGGAVTVVEPLESFSPKHYTTFFNVEPGNELLVGDFEPDPFGTPRGTLVLPPSPQSTNQYAVGSRCGFGGNTGPTVNMPIRNGCAPGPQAVLATAIQPPVNDVQFYIFDPEVALVPGGTATIDGDWQPPISFDVAITGMPQGSFPLLHVNRHYQGAILYSAFDGDGSATSGVFNGSFLQATGGDGTVTRLRMRQAEGTESLEQEILEYRDGLPNELTGDVAADLIAVPANPFPAGSESISFSVTDTTGYDAVVAQIEFDNDPIWTIVAPPPTTTNVILRPPPLPDGVFGPGQPMQEIAVSLVDTPASYAEFIHDAEPTRHQAFMVQPTAPRKVRISTATHVRD